MRQEYIDKLNNCSLGFYVNLELSGIDNEYGDLSADDFDHVDYQIENGKLLSWMGREIMDLNELDDSWWDGAGRYIEDEDEPMKMR